MSPSKRKIERNKKLAVLGKQLLKEYIKMYHENKDYDNRINTVEEKLKKNKI